MLVNLTSFLEPDWPRRAARRILTALSRVHAAFAPGEGVSARKSTQRPSASLSKWLMVALGAHLLLQVALPLRFLLYPGSVNWTEEGFRFAWRVMLTEKIGQVEYRVVVPGAETERVYPRRELTPLQYRMMATQPDMILEYALHLRERYRKTGRDAQIFADAWVSHNGRAAARLIDPTKDLGGQARSLAPAAFILAEGH
jgi:hypothetical protein